MCHLNIDHKNYKGDKLVLLNLSSADKICSVGKVMSKAHTGTRQLSLSQKCREKYVPLRY